MFLKNYTSTVPAHKSIHRIEQVLIQCGVSGITKEYSANGSINAIVFHIKLDSSSAWTVRLPSDVQKAQDALWSDYVDGDKLSDDGTKLIWNNYKKKTKKDFLDQAERTAWKIIQDWVEVQMSMIQMKQADFREVFLPYVWDGNKTFYQSLVKSGFKAMIPEKCS